MDGLKILITLNGASIVVREISAKDGKRVVKGACYLDMHPSGTRFIFSPIKFFEPTEECKLHDTAFLGEQDMPPMVAERFKLYLKQLDIEAAELKKQLEASKQKQ